MAEVIWKETLKMEEFQQISIPVGASIIHAGWQDNPVIWFRCDPDAPKELVSMAVTPTGYILPTSNLIYIGTVSLSGGALIFHIFRYP